MTKKYLREENKATFLVIFCREQELIREGEKRG